MSYVEQRTKTVRTSYEPEDRHTYHSTIAPRSSLASHNTKMTNLSSPKTTGTSYLYTSEYNFGSETTSIPVANDTEVKNVKNIRQQEKKEMRDLNERLANYIEKVRFLEAQNRKMATELEDLRNKWGKETAKIRGMYETELEEARHVLDDTAKEKSRYEILNKSLEEQNRDLQNQLSDAKRYHDIDRDQINKLNTQLAEMDGEISLLKRTKETLERDLERERKSVKELSAEVERLRKALNEMTLAHMDAENRRQTLFEEMEFLKNLHEEEMKELAGLAYRDTTAENREFWKNELSQAIRDIQNEFDLKTDVMRNELESHYNIKVQEFRTNFSKQNMETSHAKDEARKLRSQLSDLKTKFADLEARNTQLDQRYQDLLRECENKDQEHALEISSLKTEIRNLQAKIEKILLELQTLLDVKLSMELEIAAYRKLLETEENRVGLRSVVEDIIGTQTTEETRYVDIIDSASHQKKSPGKSDSQIAMKMMRGEVSAKTTLQRASKGPIAITDVSSEGKHVTLENKGASRPVKDEVLDGWRIVRTIDGRRDVSYTFDRFTLGAGKTITIYAKGSEHLATHKDLIMTKEESWGIGSHVATKLYNNKGEEKASTIQNTVYQ